MNSAESPGISPWIVIKSDFIQSPAFLFVLHLSDFVTIMKIYFSYSRIGYRQIIAKGEECSLQGVAVRILECLEDAVCVNDAWF